MSKTISEDAQVRVAKSSALDHVMAVVRDAVRQGRYAPGARVVEAELQRDLGVSRGTVREALGRLATEGLLEMHRFRGATVRALTAQETEDILDMREVLEGLVARKAAQRVARDGEVVAAPVAQAQADLEAALAAGQPDAAYLRANERYHEALIEAAGSPSLATQVHQLSTAYLRTATSGWLARESFAGSNRDHQAITAAVLAGDAASAELLMRAHIRRNAYTLRHLAQQRRELA